VSEENKAIVRHFVEEVWNKGNLDLVDETLANNYLGHDPADGEETTGPEEFKRRVEMYRTAFPDLRILTEDLLAAQDHIVLRFRSQGTHRGPLKGIAATGKRVDVTGITILRFSRGEVVEEWANWDVLGMLRQLGIVFETVGERES
jgi:steroid delta-isomerase-like uncharacterized protein